MKLERSKNALRNMCFGFINKIVGIIGPFIVRTVFIKVLGAEYLGLNSLCTSILTVLNLTELGFSSAIVFSMYEPIAKNDYDTINALLLYYKKVYRCVGCVVLGLGVILIPFFPLFIKGTYPSDINLFIVYGIYLINTSLSYFLFAYWGALINAYQRKDLISRLNTFISIVMYTVQIVVLFSVKNYYAYILITPVFTIINNLRTCFVAKRYFPNFKPEGQLSDAVRTVIKSKVSGLMINKITGVSRNAFDSIFVSMFLGLYETAIYNNYYYIMNAISSIMVLIIISLDAGVGNKVHTANVDENYNDMNCMNFIYMWISGVCTVCLVCLYQPFMSIWMGKDMLLPFSAVALLCTYFYILCMGNIRSAYVQGTGIWWEQRYRAIIEAVANILLNYILGKYFGVHGIIIATLLSLFFVNFCYGSSIIFKYYFGMEKLKEYFVVNLKYAVATIIVCSISIVLCSFVPDGIIGFIVKGGICVLVSNILYVLFYYRSNMFIKTKLWIQPKVKILIKRKR